MAKKGGIQQDAVFDEILGLMEELIEGKTFDLSKIEVKENEASSRKTYILKKNTVTKLGSFAKKVQVPRDVLLERCALVLELLMDDIVAKRRQKYPNILKNMLMPLFNEALSIEAKLDEELGGDNPISKLFGPIISYLYALSDEIENSIEEERDVDPDVY